MGPNTAHGERLDAAANGRYLRQRSPVRTGAAHPRNSRMPAPIGSVERLRLRSLGRVIDRGSDAESVAECVDTEFVVASPKILQALLH